MEAFELGELEAEHSALGKLYFEFLREPSLSMGLYVLPADGTDPQSPHTEDEVYYIASGQATITVGDEERPVTAGSVVYVAANVPHRFHSIRQELRVLVFFAPAEYEK
jgi:mannose-6-phosphate isomerase-like protein (cupin superfamily)